MRANWQNFALLSDIKMVWFDAERNYRGPWRKTPGRFFGVVLVRCYQLTLSSLIGRSCRHQPTCSEYGYEAIARHGLFGGGLLTLVRVAKCNPLGTHGFDPVPEKIVWRNIFRRSSKDSKQS